MRTFRGYDRITSDPKVLDGKPCIRGMRISVQRVLEILAQDPTRETLRDDYPELDDADVRQALAFAAAYLTDTVIPLDGTGSQPEQPAEFHPSRGVALGSGTQHVVKM